MAAGRTARSVALWAPMPPEPGDIAHYYYGLADELARMFDVTIVVRDEVVSKTSPPPNVEVVGASWHESANADVDLYLLADDARRHGYVHAHAFDRPGVLALSGISFSRFYAELCGGIWSTAYVEESRYGQSDPNYLLPNSKIRYGKGAVPSGVEASMLPARLVDRSLTTIVESASQLEVLAARCREAEIVRIPPAIRSGGPLESLGDGGSEVMVTVVCGDEIDAKTVGALLGAFAVVSGRVNSLRLTLTGRFTGANAEWMRFLLARHGIKHLVDMRPDCEPAKVLELIARGTVTIMFPPAPGTSMDLAIRQCAGMRRFVLAVDAPDNSGLPVDLCRSVTTRGTDAHQTFERMFLQAAADPTGLCRSAERAYAAIASDQSMAATASRFADLLVQAVSKRRSKMPSPIGTSPPAIGYGVNAIGSWEATTGLAEAARRSVNALLDAGVAVAMEDYDYGAPRESHRLPARLRSLPTGRPHDLEIMFLNVNELAAVPEQYLRPRFHQRTLVGSWYWELPTLAPNVREQAERVDEIWVATRFVADAFRATVTKPVEVMPCVVEPIRDESLVTGDFDLDASKVTYLFGFDAHSTIARKNPRAVIRAFAQAFSRAERERDVQLVLKTINLADLTEARSTIVREIQEVGGVLIEDDLTASEMGALTSLCDVYVSLHRAEGFGLGMAEAMYFGKPVIATGYSGNLDFMNASNSCLVGYRMRPIALGDLRMNPGAQHVYAPGHLWAEPDIVDAARWMRYLWQHPRRRATLGAEASETVRSRYHSTAVGARLRARLAQLAIDRVGRARFGGPVFGLDAPSEPAASTAARFGGDSGPNTAVAQLPEAEIG